VSKVLEYKMATGRAEPFQVALAALRDRLREGAFQPGERIAAGELADALRLSATPVREALSRLAGEGLLEDRRGQGFFLRTLTGMDIADLYRMSLAFLIMAIDPHRAALHRRTLAEPAVRVPVTDPVREVERRFADWITEGGGSALAVAYRSLQIQLGPARRFEPLVFDDLAEEAGELRALDGPDTDRLRGAALRRFHLRRIAASDRLAALVYRGRPEPEV
jgi:hypothetical protein